MIYNSFEKQMISKMISKILSDNFDDDYIVREAKSEEFDNISSYSSDSTLVITLLGFDLGNIISEEELSDAIVNGYYLPIKYDKRNQCVFSTNKNCKKSNNITDLSEEYEIVADFISSLINYRINNKIKNITYEELCNYYYYYYFKKNRRAKENRLVLINRKSSKQ